MGAEQGRGIWSGGVGAKGVSGWAVVRERSASRAFGKRAGRERLPGCPGEGAAGQLEYMYVFMYVHMHMQLFVCMICIVVLV